MTRAGRDQMSAEGDALDRFTRTADVAAARVIRSYSTSFGLATALLGRRHRQHIRTIYALVRVADEIVDGAAAGAGLDSGAQADVLGGYQAETHRAIRTGYSSDLIVHAFARTARAAGIDADLIDPFFDSMHADIPDDALDPGTDGTFRTLDADAHQRYVYGSAEVVGLMCLRVFLRGQEPSPADGKILETGARQLGAAFQNVNFLRDLADDTDRLGRGYLGERRLTDTDRDDWVRVVRSQMADARAAIPLLPSDARAAVRTALGLFAAVADRVERVPADELYRRRVRISAPRKAGIAASALVRTATEGRR